MIVLFFQPYNPFIDILNLNFFFFAEIIDNPADPQAIAAPLPNPLPNPLPDPLPLLPPHQVPRTHINPDIIQLLKELPFYGKLEKNKQLEAEHSA